VNVINSALLMVGGVVLVGGLFSEPLKRSILSVALGDPASSEAESYGYSDAGRATGPSSMRTLSSERVTRSWSGVRDENPNRYDLF
jgi:hypothetical protein